MKVERIISGKLRNNTYIVQNDNNECLLIDASCSLEDIKSHIKDLKVLGVLLTHGHYDHFVNLDQILKNFNIKCYMSDLDFDKLYNPKANYSIVFNQIFSSKSKIDDFVLLKNIENEFNIGNFNIKSFLTPGHTSGGTCYFINNELLFTGDTLFKATCGRTDLISGSSEEMKESLSFLIKRFSGFKIYPGHGGEGKVENILEFLN